MHPSNGIIGDNTSVDLPQLQQDPNELIEEKKMAKYSKTAEFKRIQEHFLNRIDFYQQYLPDGRPVAGITDKERTDGWAVANLLVSEFNQVIDMFENAKQVVDDEILSSTN